MVFNYSNLEKKEIMDEGKNIFISSTFWTDRLGPIAGLATLKEMEKIKSWKIISNLEKLKEWLKIAKKHKIKIKISQ